MIHRKKGENFTFPVTRALAGDMNAKNEFHHYVTVPYAAWIWFQDKGGLTREIHMWRGILPEVLKGGE